jgi:pyruvate kinase
MRINCAHDSTAEWGRMIANLRRAERKLGKKCRVFMDLGGPKLRTGPVVPGPPVVKCRPTRDLFGHVTAPARIWLAAGDCPAPAPADVCLTVDPAWLARVTVGDVIDLIDTRESNRRLRIVAASGEGCWAECARTTYFATGMTLSLRPRGSGDSERLRDSAIGDLPRREGGIILRKDDTLLLTRVSQPGTSAAVDSHGRILTPATISCTLPEIFDDVQAGERVFFDDGKIGGVIQQVLPDHIRIKITQTRPAGDVLRADKGINLPDSALRLPALTTKDLEDLDFIARNADGVSLSFVHDPSDVVTLQEQLARRGAAQLGVVLKIETRRGFQRLPNLLLAAMRGPCVGVMIARGDLAIECGFERMAEVQEEILWVCEAAHVPVIWATQVLEKLAKEGQPSRAEVTDAAMSERAECVMLNKGPHVVTAVRVLGDILQRMYGHQHKKIPLLRSLGLASAFSLGEGTEQPCSVEDSRPTI